jgi:hypothetical protein
VILTEWEIQQNRNDLNKEITMATKELISNTKTEDDVTIEQLGKFRIFRFSSQLISDEITAAMQKENTKNCDARDLEVFNGAFPWAKGQLVALGGKFYGGPMHICFVPLLENGKIGLLENIYGDRGTWDTTFYFLAKENVQS